MTMYVVFYFPFLLFLIGAAAELNESQIGRLNLLTAQRVANAAKSEIRSGETVRLEYVLYLRTLSSLYLSRDGLVY